MVEKCYVAIFVLQKEVIERETDQPKSRLSDTRIL